MALPNIVHLGLGNFHRAHQAWYISRVGGWTITGVVMSNRALHNELVSNNNEYLLGTWGPEGLHAQTISVFESVLLASDQATTVIDKIAEPETKMVTLTITEKGYYLNASRSRLDIKAKPIAQDLKADIPASAIGLLCAGLVKRLHNNAGPLTIISCDNLANNSTALKNIVSDFLKLKYPEQTNIEPWVRKHVSFPNSMVDRITPRLSKEAKASIDAAHNPRNLPVVVTESFSEWIITDNFASMRPNWEHAGVVIANDITSYEQRKLRLLNAAHSYLAYAGLLSGYHYVHEAINDTQLKANVHALWNEAATTISSPASKTIEDYQSALITRFSVAHIKHELEQIATDGSLKLRERLNPIIEERNQRQLNSPVCLQAFAAWIAYAFHTINAGRELNDPQADEIANTITGSNSFAEYCEAVAKLVGMPLDQLDQIIDQTETILRNSSKLAPHNKTPQGQST